MKLGRLVVNLIALVTASATSLFADDITQQIESIVIDTFDNPDQREWTEKGEKMTEERRWVAVGSKFATKEKEIQYPQLAFVDSYPKVLFETDNDQTPRKVLGIHGKFDRMGYNYIEIYPIAKGLDKNGQVIPQPIKLSGIVETIDFWAWGSNHNYTLEVYLRDYRGIPYKLEAGSLAFQGWKNIKVKVPASIPQMQSYLPREQGLLLTKIVLRTSPTERVSGFYFYLDQLKVLTDMYQSPYDGRDLLRPELIEKYFPDKVAAAGNTVQEPAKDTTNKGN